MARKLPELQKMIGSEAITKENHFEFLYHLQKALLLALKEQGRISTLELRFACEKLDEQRRRRAKTLLKKGADS